MRKIISCGLFLPCLCLLTVSHIQAASGSINVGSFNARQELNIMQPDFLQLGVGKNGFATIGSQSGQWLASQAAQINVSGGALGLFSKYELPAGGSMAIDPSTPHPALPGADAIVFAPNSLLLVNGRQAPYTSDGAITSQNPATVQIGSNAKLMLTNVSSGRTYHVLGDSITAQYADATAWAGRNAMTDSHLLMPELASNLPGFYRIVPRKAEEVYPPLDGELGGIINGGLAPAPPVQPGESPLPPDQTENAPILGTEDRHFNSGYSGVRFLSRATSVRYMDHNYDLAVTTLESASRIAIVGAVPQMLMAASSMQSDAALDRISLAGQNPAAENEPYGEHAFNLWATPLFRASHGFDLHANNYTFDFSGSLGGMILGADWNFEQHFRLGLYLAAGGGYAQSGGDLAFTTNKMGFAGAGLYAAWFEKDFSLGADVNYTTASNSLRQELPDSMEMRDLQGELTARALSAQMRAEYAFNFQNWRLLPHAGVRLLYCHTDSYSIYSNGATMDGSAIDQSIWLFPAGLTLKGNFHTENGWCLSPLLDVTLTPAAGEIEASTRIFFTGTYRDAVLRTQTRDFFTASGRLGLQAEKGPFSFELYGQLEAGFRTSGQSVQANFIYKF